MSSAELADGLQVQPGYFHLGIPISGAMDRFAMRAANMLVGNDESAAGLEAVFMGPELEFTSDATVAVTGADMPIAVDGEERPGWSSFSVKSGSCRGATMNHSKLLPSARIIRPNTSIKSCIR